MNRNEFRLVRRVAAWEYNRFFKWKDVLKGLMWTVLIGFLSFSGTRWLMQDASDTPVVGILHNGVFLQETWTTEGLELIDATGMTEAQLAAFDAVLEIVSADEARLRMEGDRPWTGRLQTYLDSLRTDLRLKETGIDRALFENLGAPITLVKSFTGEAPKGRIPKILAAISIALVLIAVFLSFAYQFTAITGEKQQRITEQVVAAISPQTWIDGKIIGISAIGISHVALYSLLTVGVFGVIGLMTDAPFASFFAAVDAYTVLLFFLFALTGILMWNAFLAGVAATIDDPNSSQKSGLMMLPTVPPLFAFLVLMDPTTTAVMVLSWFPLTSYAVMPARMVLDGVAWWEPLGAWMLLAATAWLFRLVAGRIFRLGMLLYGKEPGFKEILRWIGRT